MPSQKLTTSDTSREEERRRKTLDCIAFVVGGFNVNRHQMWNDTEWGKRN